MPDPNATRSPAPDDAPTPAGGDPDATGPGADPAATVSGPGTRARAGAPLSGYAARYELGAEIARGGMGAVYRATDTAFGREVAVKVLLDKFAPTSGTARRFYDEARITGQLQHPNIPAVHDLGTLPDGRPFLAMKLIKGDTLDELLKARPDPAVERGRFVALFEQVCQALAYAHAHDVIHRDLKPSNVMVGNYGDVQVMDWGLAKVLGVREAEATEPDETGSPTAIQSIRESDSAYTQAGSVLGTPAYMPPEQAIGAIHKVDARSDVFGLGAILSVVLTGKPPFTGTSVETTRLQAAQGNVEDCYARLDASGAEPELVALCKRCLSKRAEDRPANAEEVARAVAALRAAADERARQAELDRVKAEGEKATAEATAAEEQNTRREAEARENEQRKRRRVQLALAGFVVLVAVGGGVAAYRVQQQRADDQLAAEKQRAADLRQTRAESLVQALTTADTAGVPRIAADLAEVRDLARTRLVELATQPVTTKPGLHARMALLADEPQRAGELVTYLPTCKPDELLTVRDTLKPHANTVAPKLWSVLTDAKADAGRRVRAAGALAGLAPGDARWAALAPEVADAATRASPTEFATVLAALEPVRAKLVPVLLARYSDLRREIEGGKLDVPGMVSAATAFDRAANLLARYAERPDDLAELALLADPRHFELFAPALRAKRAEVVPVLAGELVRSVRARWNDAPPKPEWVAVPPEVAKAVEGAAGVLHERFALVQVVPLAEFERLANTLGASGYRPTRVRPYTDGDKVLVAAVWVRDGTEWKVLVGATADAVRARDAELKRDGFEPTDVAAWVEPGAQPVPTNALAVAAGGACAVSVTPPLRFAAVWRAAPNLKAVSRLYLAVPADALFAATAVFKNGPSAPLAVQAVRVPGELGARYSSVWGTAPVAWHFGWERTAENYRSGRAGQWCVDAALVRNGMRMPVFAAVWHSGQQVEVEQLTALPVLEHAARARQLAAAGWQPVGLSVADAQLACSVWHPLPVAEAAQEAYGKRRGYAAAALVALGEGSRVWPVFAFPKDGDPTARSYLLERLTAVGADPGTLIERYEVEADVSANRALLVALGDFPLSVVPVPAREALTAKLLVQYREHADPGLHGAIDWLLRQKWGKARELADIDHYLSAQSRARVASRVVVPFGPVPIGGLLPLQALLEVGTTPNAAENSSPPRWVYAGGAFRWIGEGRWAEDYEPGKKRLFVEKGYGEWVELYDASRDIGVRLYSDKMTLRQPGTTDYVFFRVGRWAVPPIRPDAANSNSHYKWPAIPSLLGKGWFTNGEGQTFAVVRGPVEFQIGSPLSEPQRGEDELLHAKRISRTFAIATKEVTVEQFLRFRPNHDPVKLYSPGPENPATGVTWYRAAEYCNWLSAREGIPRDQWCYEPNEKGAFGEGMKIKPGHLKLTGYRLPTEAEWEFACRAGAVTARYHGRGEDLLPRYAWFVKNSDNRAWPVGRLRPNELGLFDVLGNASEQCEDPAGSYTMNEREDIGAFLNALIDERSSRLLRGSMYTSAPVNLRCAHRFGQRPGTTTTSIGFRPARTVP